MSGLFVWIFGENLRLSNDDQEDAWHKGNEQANINRSQDM